MFGLEGLTVAKLVITILAMVGISALFSIFGRGGGEFKLPVLITVLTMLPYFDIATISLFCIYCCVHRNKRKDIFQCLFCNL